MPLMKILYLCTYYHRAMIFRDAMNSLEKLGNTILAFNAAVKGDKVSPKYMGIMDDKVIHSECFSKLDRLFYYHKQKKFLRSLEEKIDVSKFDLIHSHTLLNGGWVALYIKRKLGIPYVVSVRDTDLNVFLKLPFFKPIAKKIIMNASGILFLSSSYREALIRKFESDNEVKDKIRISSVIISNAVEDFWLENIAVSPKRHNGKTISILSVGKINKNKNMISVVKAMKILKSKGIDAKCTIIGQVVNEKVMEELKAQDNVTIVDYLTKEELIRYYKANDIFVLPSFHESFGRVYAEAMTQGMPVVFTKDQGFDGLYEQGHVGYAVIPDDIDEIADSIMKIMNNYEKVSENCIVESRKYNWDTIGSQLDSFYHRCIGKEEGSN